MACLLIYRELLSLVTFLRVHLNSKEVSYLSWQNTYPNLKPTKHGKVKLFLWTKLLENLLLAIYIISAAVPLNDYEKCFLFHLKSSFCSRYIQIFVFPTSLQFFPVNHCLRWWFKINLKVYNVSNCLNKNLIHILFDISREKKDMTLKL